MAVQDVFIRRSSGLTRQISPRDALMYAAMNPGLLFSCVYIMWAPIAYQGAHMGAAVAWVLLMFPIAGLYWYFSVAMPRSGGEYIYISRALHPALGLWASFMISVTGISWLGVLTDWWIKWGLNDAIRGIGIIQQNQGLISLADTLDGNWPRFIIGSISILLVTGWVFLKGTRLMMRLSYWAVAVSWLAVLIIAGLALFAGQGAFQANFDRLSGTTYQAVLDAGRRAGAVFEVSFYATMLAGVSYVALNTLGATYSANLAGEIRGVSRSQALALFGSMIIQMAIWFAMYQLLYVGVGREFIHSMDTLYNFGSTQQGYPPAFVTPAGSDPFPTLYVAFLSANPILVAIFGLCFLVSTWASAAGLAFAPIRNIFAWSFDRLVPTKLSEIGSKYRAPTWAVVVTVLAAYVFFFLDVWRPDIVTGILYSTAAWFLGWIILGIAGIVFPYRRRELFESAPLVTQTRIAGIPVISILGAATLVVSLFVEWAVVKPFLDGIVGWDAMWPVYVMAVIPVVIYVVAHFYHQSRGIPLALQFSQVPPE
jgi:amino acid transporter